MPAASSSAATAAWMPIETVMARPSLRSSFCSKTDCEPSHHPPELSPGGTGADGWEARLESSEVDIDARLLRISILTKSLDCFSCKMNAPPQVRAWQRSSGGTSLRLDVLRHQTVSDFDSGSVPRALRRPGIWSGATMRSIAGTGRRESLIMGRIGIPELLVILFI